MLEQTVVIVDDDAAFRESMEALLCASGVETRSYASGTDFLASPDFGGNTCVLLDYHLPDINGLDLLDSLKARETKGPVVMVSGDAPNSVKNRALALGAVAALDKPIDGLSLLRTIETALCAA